VEEVAEFVGVGGGERVEGEGIALGNEGFQLWMLGVMLSVVWDEAKAHIF
jgi:hypothetical protein